eukprot:3740274-Rhodomonas_salina.3
MSARSTHHLAPFAKSVPRFAYPLSQSQYWASRSTRVAQYLWQGPCGGGAQGPGISIRCLSTGHGTARAAAGSWAKRGLMRGSKRKATGSVGSKMLKSRAPPSRRCHDLRRCC